jgi:hypothetical protein
VSVDTRWLDREQLGAWVRLVTVMELLPGVLDGQLRRDAQLTHFDYYVLAMLSESPERTLRMTAVAQRTGATLARLSHVGHVATVRQHVIDALTPEQVTQLKDITDAILSRLDPDGARAALYTRYDAG